MLSKNYIKIGKIRIRQIDYGNFLVILKIPALYRLYTYTKYDLVFHTHIIFKMVNCRKNFVFKIIEILVISKNLV